MTQTDGIAEAKARARKAAEERRRLAHATPGAATAAAAALVAEIDGLRGRVIAGYLPIRTEADPLPAMTAAAAANRICVPVIDAPGRPLRFREWHPGCALAEGPFKVQVPAAGDWLVPDLLVVPLLAWDATLNRLGYGGGFYDRTLVGLRAAGPTEAWGFAFAAQRDDSLPREPTDAPLDALVTEAGTLRR